MSSFTPLTVVSSSNTSGKNAKGLTAENRYRKSFKFPAEPPAKHYGKVTHLAFSPSKPHLLAAAASTKITLYESPSLNIAKQLSRFKSIALAPSFRLDGKVLAAGSEEGLIQLFDLQSRAILRTLKGHKGAVYSTLFSTNYSHFLSGSDDKTVRLWDVPTEKQLLKYDDLHSDYVRSLVANPLQESVFVSGGYDHQINVIDIRMKASSSSSSSSSSPSFSPSSSSSSSAALSLRHPHPVSALCFAPQGNLLFAAGDNLLNVYDLISGGKLLFSFSPHQKTITSLFFDEDEERFGTRLVSSSIDQFVKFYDVKSDFQVTHSYSFPKPILCAALSPDHQLLAAGTVDGSLLCRKRSKLASSVASSALPTPKIRPGTARYFSRGAESLPAEDDYAVAHLRKARLAPYDRYLQKFDYKGALDSALQSNKAVVICTVLDELIERDALLLALSSRADGELEGLLRFLIHYCCVPALSSLLLDVIALLLDVYGGVVGQSPLFDELLLKLKQKVKEELQVQNALLNAQGTIESFVQASNHYKQLAPGGKKP